jgi:hypothetical protein
MRPSVRFPLQGATPAAQQSRIRGICLGTPRYGLHSPELPASRK